VSHPSRLAVLSDLNARLARAETEVARWEGVVERLNAAGEPTRAARNCLRAAQDDLDRLDRARDVLLEGGEGLPPRADARGEEKPRGGLG
jgi:hypothetical protein